MKIMFVDKYDKHVMLDPCVEYQIRGILPRTIQAEQGSGNRRNNIVSFIALGTLLLILIVSLYIAMNLRDVNLVVEKDMIQGPPIPEISIVSSEISVEPENGPEEFEVAEAAISTAEYFKPQALSQELFEIIVEECHNSNVPVNAVLAIMKTETQNFSENSTNYNTNGTCDYGIMQINSSNINSFSTRYNCPEFAQDPFTSKANITVGIRYFAEMWHSYMESYQDEVKTLLAAAGAYNRGAGNQNRYKNIYEYNARVYAHYINICQGIDVNINYAAEIPAIKEQLQTKISL